MFNLGFDNNYISMPEITVIPVHLIILESWNLSSGAIFLICTLLGYHNCKAFEYPPLHAGVYGNVLWSSHTSDLGMGKDS